MALKDNWIDKIDGVDINSASDINQVAHAVIELEKNGGVQGADGATFIPSVSDDGVISWTNDRGLENPAPKNIKGGDGITPHIGANGNWFIGAIDTGVKARGEDGYTPVKGADYWTEADKAEIKAYVDEAILGGAW